MLTALRIALALVLGIFGPRARGLVLTLLALSMLLAGGVAALAVSTMPIVVFALLAFTGLLSACVLPKIFPRTFIGLFAVLEIPLLQISAERFGRATLILAIAAVLAILILAVKRPEMLMRLVCAMAGALLGSSLLPAAHHTLWLAGAFATLFGIEEAVRRLAWSEYDYLSERQFEYERDRTEAIEKLARIGGGAGAMVALAFLCLPMFAQPLALPIFSERPELPPLPFAERREALAAQVPGGGLIWPLPSEAMFWDEPNLDRHLFPCFDNLDALFLGLQTGGLAKMPGTSPLGRISLHKPIAALRLVHDPAAVARLRAAAEATVASLHDILPLVKPGTPEAELERALKVAMRAHGCGPESFPLIFASGPAAAAPHGNGNLGTLAEGTLVVADIGCSIDHYASDFTRTLPVSKTFSPRQRQLYEGVLAAQNAALAMCKPDEFLSHAQQESMEKSARAVLKAHAPDGDEHMDHGLGHTVGLFVHDVLLPGPLAEGNVITIEPGTYLQNELGIRIEDTFLVTKAGCERLTEGFPAEPAAIEAAMR